MAILSFDVAYGTTLEEAKNAQVNGFIYAEDLNLCQSCIYIIGDCFACLTVNQQIFSDSSLTTLVPDGYYRHPYNENIQNPTWRIVNGKPQPGGFIA